MSGLRRGDALLALGIAMLPISVAEAADIRFMPDPLPSDAVRAIMDTARDNLPAARLPDGSQVPEESAADRQSPILSETDAERIIDVGFASAFAKWCGVEWEKSNYARLMAAERARQIHSDKAMAYIGLLHGPTMGIMQQAHDDAPCPEDAKRRVQGFIADRWQ